VKQIKILTDSTADLPPSLIKELGITVVALKVLFPDKVYQEGVDITPKEFYEKLQTTDKLPTTSQPTLVDFLEAYHELTSDGSAVISIHISSLMSGTSQTALLARSQLPEADITVVDSKLVCMALGMVALSAARAAKEKKSKEEILQIISQIMGRVQTYFVVDTLEYLQKGGRIGKASALLGTMLNIKPVLSLQDGIIVPFEKIRGKGKALDHIVEVAKAYAKVHGKVNCAILHGNVLDEAIKFHQKIVSEVPSSEIIICEIGAVVGTHAGPGTIALFFYAESTQV
jgi:DegV family protein with EDD domain